MPSARHPSKPPRDGLSVDSDIVKLGLDNPDTVKIATLNAPNTAPAIAAVRADARNQ